MSIITTAYLALLKYRMDVWCVLTITHVRLAVIAPMRSEDEMRFSWSPKQSLTQLMD